MIALALALLAAAAAAPPAAYRALGTEPFWSLAIEGRTATLREPGRADDRLLVRRPVATANGWRWRTRALLVETVRAACSDGMSDRRYPERVTVRWRGRELKGCGGMAVESEAAGVALHGTQWRIAAIDGRAVRLGAGAVTLRFEGDRISGQAGCNRLNGRWRLERGRLAITEVAMTRRACVGESETIESRFNALTAAPLAVSRRGETIVLTNAAGSMTLASL